MGQGDRSGSPLPVRECVMSMQKRHRNGPHCLPLVSVDRFASSASEQEQPRLAQQDPRQLLGGDVCSVAPCQGWGSSPKHNLSRREE